MPYETVIYEKKDGVAVITINRAERKNSLSTQLVREMNQVLDEIEQDDEVKVLILTGSPECFCAGADLKELPFPPTFLMETNSLFNRIEDLGKPSIAAISGWCLAGGLEMAMCCDLRVASEAARIGDHHIRIGAIGGGGATTRLPHIVGIAKAKELIYTGETVSGEEAQNIGLVNRVYPPDKYLEGALELANKIAGMLPSTVKWTKVSLNASLDLDRHSSLHYSDWCTTNIGLAGIGDWKDQRAGRE